MTDSRRIPSLAPRLLSALAHTAVVSLGLSAGASLMEAVALVKIWRAMSPEAFLDWFAEGEPRLAAFFGPIQVATLVLTLVATAGAAATRRRAAVPWAVAAGFSLAVLVLFFVYFSAANTSFVARTISLDAVPAELARWEQWQWMRTACGAGAFVAGLVALVRDVRGPKCAVAGGRIE